MGATKGYFVTGTGTGVGKTFVTCQLARCARAAGKRVFAFKPIETGCTMVNGRLIGADQELVCEAAGSWQTGALRGVYQFVPPVAPSVAAEQAHVKINLGSIHQALDEGEANVDVVLVEGAGGWRVPITRDADMSHLAESIGYPVIVVGLATLGTINHSLLTLEAVERDGQQVAALVLSKRPEDDTQHVIDNARRIATRWKGTIIIHQDQRDLAPLVG